MVSEVSEVSEMLELSEVSEVPDVSISSLPSPFPVTTVEIDFKELAAEQQ